MAASKQYIKAKKAIIKGKSENKELVGTLKLAVQRLIPSIKHNHGSNKICDTEFLDNLDSAEAKLDEMNTQYHEKAGNKYIIAVVTGLIFGLTTYFSLPFIYMATTNAFYDRRGVESLCNKYFGNDTMVTEALTEEIMIVSFDYNHHEPRLFTKYTAKDEPSIYNVTITDAAEASSSAPFYFAPKVIKDQVLIDGGVIANNPALYSLLHSVY
jgi:patatin-like phospholipase/acyl hydrolase